MFSVEQKQTIAAAIDKVIKDIQHPEMDNEKPFWELHVQGKADWSYATIHPNHEPVQGPPNRWNEIVAEIIKNCKDRKDYDE